MSDNKEIDAVVDAVASKIEAKVEKEAKESASKKEDKPKRDHHKRRVPAFEAVTKLDRSHFTEFDPALTPEESAALDAALAAANDDHDAGPLGRFWQARYKAASKSEACFVRAYGIIHYLDHDDNDYSKIKDPHIHFTAEVDDRRHALDPTELSHAFGIVQSQFERPKQREKIRDFVENKLAYEIHALESDPGKHHYDPKCVATIAGEDFRFIEARSRRKWSFARAKKSFKDMNDEVAYQVERIVRGELTREDVLKDDHMSMVYASSTKATSSFDNAFKIAGMRQQLSACEAIDWGNVSKTCIWVYGESGTGKSSLFSWVLIHWLQAEYGWRVFEGGTKNSFDHYAGEEILFLDEVRAKNKSGDGLAFADLLRMADPHRANKMAARYNNVLLSSRLIIVTSNLPLMSFCCYSSGVGKSYENFEQAVRRFDYEVECLRPETYGYCCVRSRPMTFVEDGVEYDRPLPNMDNSYIRLRYAHTNDPVNHIEPYVSFLEAICDIIDNSVLPHAGLGSLTYAQFKSITTLYQLRAEQVSQSFKGLPTPDPMTVRNRWGVPEVQADMAQRNVLIAANNTVACHLADTGQIPTMTIDEYIDHYGHGPGGPEEHRKDVHSPGYMLRTYGVDRSADLPIPHPHCPQRLQKLLHPENISDVSSYMYRNKPPKLVSASTPEEAFPTLAGVFADAQATADDDDAEEPDDIEVPGDEEGASDE